jgi:nitronate monooxygenase/enoyl-[acyl-carrier protein] reductase II
MYRRAVNPAPDEEEIMLRTALCPVLGIKHPVIQGPLGGPWPPSVGLAAAVSEAGALGSLPTTLRRPEQVREDAARLRDLTSRPFAINHTMRPFVEEVFQVILDPAPSVISFALGRSPEIIKRAHDAGALFVQQVHSVDQAVRAAEDGADVIIAQGGEAGGFGGAPGTIVLVPQVAEPVHPNSGGRGGRDRRRSGPGGGPRARSYRRERRDQVPGVR